MEINNGAGNIATPPIMRANSLLDRPTCRPTVAPDLCVRTARHPPLPSPPVLPLFLPAQDDFSLADFLGEPSYCYELPHRVAPGSGTDPDP